jgi:ribosomal protein L37E
MLALCAKIADMSDDIHIRCMRCGDQMEMRDPGKGMPWTPDQFWVCVRCGRHFWTTYPPPKPASPTAAAPKPATEPVS